MGEAFNRGIQLLDELEASLPDFNSEEGEMPLARISNSVVEWNQTKDEICLVLNVRSGITERGIQVVEAPDSSSSNEFPGSQPSTTINILIDSVPMFYGNLWGRIKPDLTSWFIRPAHDDLFEPKVLSCATSTASDQSKLTIILVKETPSITWPSIHADRSTVPVHPAKNIINKKTKPKKVVYQPKLSEKSVVPVKNTTIKMPISIRDLPHHSPASEKMAIIPEAIPAQMSKDSDMIEEVTMMSHKRKNQNVALLLHRLHSEEKRIARDCLRQDRK